MCVSKTLVAIKQGEFPGGKLLGETGNRQDAGPQPTYTHNALFYPCSILKRFKRLFASSYFWRLSQILMTILILQTQNVHKTISEQICFCDVRSPKIIHIFLIEHPKVHYTIVLGWLSIEMIIVCYFCC